ncbi:MAG: XRE family transcriptional regulator [Deltaproteobacteria bacterium]|nr:XRE family transcriptional regulator [Deltaproteobacteria bacterium]
MYSTHSKRKRKRRPSKISKLPGSAIERSSNAGRRRRERQGKQITHGSNNVFEDVGFETGEAANLKVRADLLLDLRQYIQARGWTQAEAAAFFGETQPRISNLLKGEISRFSIDKLINMLAHAGIRVRLETEPQAA